MTQKRQREIASTLRTRERSRIKATPKLPETLSEFDNPDIVNMFKMMAIIDHGDSSGWEQIRAEFIQNNMNAPGSDKVNNINAALLTQITNQDISNVDQVMNDMAMDTNDVIEQIQAGTVDVDDGSEELQKMKMAEGNMPGQGKQKQGSWRA